MAKHLTFLKDENWRTKKCDGEKKKFQKDGIAQATDRPASIKSSRILIHKTVVCKYQEMLILKIQNKTTTFPASMKASNNSIQISTADAIHCISKSPAKTQIAYYVCMFSGNGLFFSIGKYIF